MLGGSGPRGPLPPSQAAVPSSRRAAFVSSVSPIHVPGPWGSSVLPTKTGMPSPRPRRCSPSRRGRGLPSAAAGASRPTSHRTSEPSASLMGLSSDLPRRAFLVSVAGGQQKPAPAQPVRVLAATSGCRFPASPRALPPARARCITLLDGSLRGRRTTFCPYTTSGRRTALLSSCSSCSRDRLCGSAWGGVHFPRAKRSNVAFDEPPPEAFRSTASASAAMLSARRGAG